MEPLLWIVEAQKGHPDGSLRTGGALLFSQPHGVESSSTWGAARCPAYPGGPNPRRGAAAVATTLTSTVETLDVALVADEPVADGSAALDPRHGHWRTARLEHDDI